MLQIYRSNGPLTRAGVAFRFAAVATAYVLLLLPLFAPLDYLYHRAELCGYGGSLLPGIHWRVALIVLIVASCAFALAYVWASRAGRVYFSAYRGLLNALLTFLYMAVFVSLLGHSLSDESTPFVRFALLGFLYLPFLWLIPIIGAVAGSFLARRVAPSSFLASGASSFRTSCTTCASGRRPAPRIASRSSGSPGGPSVRRALPISML